MIWLVNAGVGSLSIFAFPREGSPALGQLHVGRVVRVTSKFLFEGRVWCRLARGFRGDDGRPLGSRAFVLDAKAGAAAAAAAASGDDSQPAPGLVRVAGPGPPGSGAWPKALKGATPWSALYGAKELTSAAGASSLLALVLPVPRPPLPLGRPPPPFLLPAEQ